VSMPYVDPVRKIVEGQLTP